MELSELTQSQSYEADALTFGLLVYLVVGFCIVVGFCAVCAYLFQAFVTRSPYDETSGPQYPADDVHNPDVWDLAERYRRDNPERAYFPREGK